MAGNYNYIHLTKSFFISCLLSFGVLTSISAPGQNVTLNGSVYADVDSTCSETGKDIPLDTTEVKLLDNANNAIDSTSTNSSGDYSFQVDTSTYSTVKVKLTDTGEYLHSCQNTIQTANNPETDTINFGLNRPSGAFAQKVYPGQGVSGNCINPNQPDTFRLDIKNGTPGPVDYRINFGDGNGYTSVRSAQEDSIGGYNIAFANNYQQTGTYTITAYAVNANGEVDKVETTIVVSNTCETISGSVYVDSNNNCTYDSFEEGYGNRNVKLTTDTDTLLAITKTNQQGQYNFSVAKGQDYKIVFKDTGKLTIGCSGNGIQKVNSVSASNVNFGLNCFSGTDYGVGNTSVELASWRIGMARNLNFSVNSVLSCNSDSLRGINIILDSTQFTADSFYPNNPSYPKFTSKNGDTVKYNLQQNSAAAYSNVKLPIYTDTSASINDTLCVTINLLTNNDNDPSNDSKIICQNATNSFDPNNKRVSPEGTDSLGFIQDSTTLTYTVNFQNTGNATAQDVTIKDTLDKGLDPSTLTVIGASTSTTPSPSFSQNVVTFDFNNINLPDSGSNLSGSKGYVTFEISPKAGVGPDTQFTNYADIFFDQNPPIRTDTVINTICSPIGDTIQLQSCDSVYYQPEDTSFFASGKYFDTFTATNGCDSVLTVDYEVLQNTSSNVINDSACGTYVVPSGDESYVVDTFVTDTLKNKAGCDSFLLLNITIKDTVTDTMNVTTCSSYTVPSDDETYTNTGQYNDTVTDSSGCIKFLTINLNITPNPTKVINVNRCNKYEVPSGDETYKTSGQYRDTIQGAGGCDTVLTINLKIKKFVRDTISRSVCDSFTVPSGDETYQNSGTYLDTIVRPNTCDSILEIDLSILPDKQGAINVTTCNSYTVPSGDETYTSGGTYQDTVPSSAGCDSVIFISLTFQQAINNTISRVACNSYTVPSGDETYNVDGTYKDTLLTNDGCDSILTINLTVKEEVTSTISATSCGPYTVPSGDETYTVSGTYRDTIPSSKGCDSVITINLTAGEDKQVTTSIKSCNSYTVPSGDETYTNDGTYQDTIPTAAGCDSILTINLTFGSLDTSLTQSGKTLIANAPNAQYQWLICDSNGYRPIDGSSDKRFRAFKSNSYAVAITQGNCQDTSACYSVQNVGFPGKRGGDNIKIYPNPAEDKLNVVVNRNVNQLEMINMTGQRIIQKDVIGGGAQTLDLNNVAGGIYMLKLYSDKGIQSRKVMVK